MKEPLRRRLTVTSSLKGISTEIGWWRGEEALLLTLLYLFLQQTSRKFFKDDANGFSSISDICFGGEGHSRLRERGGGPNSDEGTYTVVLYRSICMYFVV